MLSNASGGCLKSRPSVIARLFECVKSHLAGDGGGCDGDGELAANNASSISRAAIVGYLFELSALGAAGTDSDTAGVVAADKDDGAVWLLVLLVPLAGASRHSHSRPRYLRWWARAHDALQNTSVLAHVTHAAAPSEIAAFEERSTFVML